MSTTLPATVDEMDRALLELLRVDGRASNRSLAGALGVNETTIATRLRRLEERGVMRIVAMTDMHAFGLHYLGFVLLRVNDRSAIAVGEAVAGIEEVVGVVTTTGGFDVVLTVVARDPAHLADVMAAVAAVEGVEQARCDMGVDIPRWESRYAGLRLDAHRLPRPPACDGWNELDLSIIEALQHDARASNRKVAATLDVSEATIRARIRRMEQERSIRIQAVSDIQAFGLEASGYLMVQAQPGAMDAVRARLLATQECGVVARTLGGTDFVALVVAEARDRLLSVALEDIAHDPAVKAVSLLETHAMIKHVYTWAQL